MSVSEQQRDATAAQAATEQDIAELERKVYARLYGEPILELPRDLFIPPDAMEVFLEAFEGPLDLLLYMIRKQNFDILDIPVAEVTHQYLTYIEEIRSRNLELAAEYLLMAALLINIKSRMLLPVRHEDTGEEVEDPRAELARRLVEYEKIKLVAMQLNEIPRAGREFVRAQVYVEQSMTERLPDVDPLDLRAAWADIVRRARLTRHHQLPRESLSVREHMSKVLRRLKNSRFAEFNELFETGEGLPVVVVTFLALLELARESLVEITQAEAYAPIYVRLTYEPS